MFTFALFDQFIDGENKGNQAFNLKYYAETQVSLRTKYAIISSFNLVFFSLYFSETNDDS
jgi:hypothetical protein